MWGFTSTMAIAFRCHLPQPWIMDEACNNMAGFSLSLGTESLTNPQFLRWKLIGAFDIATEIALFLMAIYLVVDLRMPFHLKAFVVTAFAFRLP